MQVVTRQRKILFLWMCWLHDKMQYVVTRMISTVSFIRPLRVNRGVIAIGLQHRQKLFRHVLVGAIVHAGLTKQGFLRTMWNYCILFGTHLLHGGFVKYLYLPPSLPPSLPLSLPASLSPSLPPSFPPSLPPSHWQVAATRTGTVKEISTLVENITPPLTEVRHELHTYHCTSLCCVFVSLPTLSLSCWYPAATRPH